MQEVDQEASRRASSPMALAHLALAVQDQERSRHFYESYFGFDAGASNVLDNGVLFIRDRHGFELALAARGKPASMPAFVHFGFRMGGPEEVSALKARLDDDGVEIMDEEQGRGFMSFKCRDPDGYLVEAYWNEGTGA